MKLTFRIQYRTVWGEHLRVILNGDEENAFALFTRDGNEWQGACDYQLPAGTNYIEYRYCVFRNSDCIRKELGAIPHLFYIGNAQQSHYIMDDCWRDLPTDDYKYSSAFNSPHPLSEPKRISNGAGTCITFRALCPGLSNKDQELGIIGSCEALGKWEYYRPLRMSEVRPNVWHLTINASTLEHPFEYKFVAINSKTGAVEEWEKHPNRSLHTQPLLRGETYLPHETEVFFDLPERKIAGTAIPVFSIRSEGSCGIGDFGDLIHLIDWAVKTHQKAIQILPINDTTMTHTWKDSYPYNSISIYAFNPIYIDLRQLPRLEDDEEAKKFEEERVRLNELPAVDYEGVNKMKWNYLKKLYAQEGTKTLQSAEFNSFYEKNEHWLKPYAVFCYLRDKFHTSDFNSWPEYNVYKKEEIDLLYEPDSPSRTFILFYCYLQYILHVQLLKAANHARKEGVILKGDIPIGISRCSVEAWVEPYYFNMNGQAGAPPDAFSTKGQNWGFPTYNWDVMEKDNYLWWRRRLSKMSEYFTAYRIDHILGFFRIWEIPIHSVHGILGQFNPSMPMTVDEIKSFGLNFREDEMTTPYISEYMINTIFGEKSEEVKKIFVRPKGKDLYEMCPEFDTQRKVEAYFIDKTDEESLKYKENLYNLISDVLFIADRNDPTRYHPRIAVQNDYVYKQLNWLEQQAFNNLYNHYYYQRHNEFWYKEAMKKLPVLTQSTRMLVCGEDLGMVPDCVPWVMKQLQILSLEIQRMPKDSNQEFGHVYAYPKQSVCSTGTHDMSTLRGWWEENQGMTADFYHYELGHWGEIPQHAPGWLCKEIIGMHLNSPSLLCILPWQDWTSMEDKLRTSDTSTERINVPANPNNYWQWRMHITLEELMKHSKFNEEISRMIDESNR